MHRERIVDVGAAFVARAHAAHALEPSEGAPDDVTDFAEPGSVGKAASGYLRLDPALPQPTASR